MDRQRPAGTPPRLAVRARRVRGGGQRSRLDGTGLARRDVTDFGSVAQRGKPDRVCDTGAARDLPPLTVLADWDDALIHERPTTVRQVSGAFVAEDLIDLEETVLHLAPFSPLRSNDRLTRLLRLTGRRGGHDWAR